MIRYMLDTNICIYIINAKPLAVLERFKLEAIGSIAISCISAAELAYGVAKSGSDKNRAALEMFLAPLAVVPFDENAIWQYGQLRTDLEKRGHPIGPMDTMIAAHALALNTTLVTNNTREFARVEGLLMENWVLTA